MPWRMLPSRGSRAVVPTTAALPPGDDIDDRSPGKDVASERTQILACSSLGAYVLASAIVPSALVFGDEGHNGPLLAAAFVSTCASAVFAMEVWADAEGSLRGLVRKLQNPANLLPVLPLGLLLYVTVGDSHITSLALGSFLLRFRRTFGTNWVALVAALKRVFPSPPKQLVRLGWLAMLVVVMQSLASCIYYALGRAVPASTSWIDVDDIRNGTSQRQREDSSSPAALRISRSIYFVWQTLLTVGYGGIAPVAVPERAFSLVVCLAGVFLMAYMIANLTSYLVNLDSTPAAHRFTLDNLETLFSQKPFSNAAKRVARRDLARQWARSKGVSREKVLDDLPPSLARNIVKYKAAQVVSAPLFRLPQSSDPCRRAVFYLVDKLEPSIFDPGRTLREPWSAIPYRPGVMWILLDGTATKRTRKAPPALQLPSGASSNSLRARAMSKFRSRHAEDSPRAASVTPSPRSPRFGFKSLQNSPRRPDRSFTASSAVLWGDPGVDLAAAGNHADPDVARDLAQEVMESYPDMLTPGSTIGALRLFDVLQAPAPRYVALTRCELVFLTFVEFRRMALLFPEWGMESASQRVMRAMEARRMRAAPSGARESKSDDDSASATKISTTTSSTDDDGVLQLDERIVDQLDAECAYSTLARPDLDDDDDDDKEEKEEEGRNADAKSEVGVGRKPKSSSGLTLGPEHTKRPSLREKHTLRKKKSSKIAAIMQQEVQQETGQHQGLMKWLAHFSFEAGSRADILWDCAVAVVLAGYGVFVPIHLAMLSAGILISGASALTAFATLLGDSLFLASWTLRPLLRADMLAAAASNSTGGNATRMIEALQMQRIARSRSISHSSAKLLGENEVSSQVSLSAMAWSTQQEALAKRREELAMQRARILARVERAVEFVLTILSLVTFILQLVASKNVSDASSLDDLARVATLLRAPFLLRLSRTGAIIDSLGTHFFRWRQARRLAHAIRSEEAEAFGHAMHATHARHAGAAVEESDGEHKGPFLSVRLGVYFLLWAHVIACYGMTIGDDSAADDDSVPERYVVGVYWSLATMTTTGFGDIEPYSARSSIFTSILAIVGVSIYSCLVSFVGTLLKDVEFSDNNITHQRTCLNAFLLDRKVHPNLQAKVAQYLHYVEANDLLVVRRVLGVSDATQSAKFAGRAQRSALDAELAPGRQTDLSRVASAVSASAAKRDFWAQIHSQIAARDVGVCPRSHASDFLRAEVRQQLVFDLTAGLLRSSLLFAHVSEAFVREACALLNYRIVSADDVIIEETDAEWALYFLSKGSVEVRGANELKLRVIPEGQVFGEQVFAQLGQKIDAQVAGPGPSSTALLLATGEPVAPPTTGKRANGAGSKDKTKFVATSVSELWVLHGRVVRHLALVFPEDGAIVTAAEKRLATVETRETVASNLKRGGKLAKMAGSDADPQQTRRGPRVFALESRVQETWRIIMFLVVMWNYVVFPVRVAFEWAHEPFIFARALDALSDLLLIVDLPLRLRFFELETAQGERLTDPTEFRAAYARSLYGITDMISAVPVEIVTYGITTLHSPLFRLNKLFRGARMLNDLGSIGSHVKNQAQTSLITILKLVLVLLLVAHWTGCLFYRIGLASVRAGEESWIDAKNGGLVALFNETDMSSSFVPLGDASFSWTHHYVDSLYFAIATVTAVGFGDVVPISQAEILFTIAILILGGLLYSVVIAFLEDIVAQSDLTSILFQKKSDLISAYSSMRQFPTKLRTNVRSYVFRTWVHQKGVNDDHILGYLSRSLRRQVAVELIGEQVLRRTPVLGPSQVWRFVGHAFRFDRYRRDAVLFHAGQTGEHLFYIIKGTVEIVSPDLERVFYQVEAGGLVGLDGFFRSYEAGSAASARCRESCEVGILDREAVREALLNNPHLLPLFDEEMKQFVSKPSQLEHTKKNLDKRKLTKMFQDQEGLDKNLRKKGFSLDRYVIAPGGHSYVIFHVAVFYGIVLHGLLNPLWNTVSATTVFEMQKSPAPFVAISLVLDVALWATIAFKATLIARVKGGRLLTEFKAIRRAYVFSWEFALDLLAVVPLDLLAYAVSSTSSGLHLFFDLRMLRLLWFRHVPSLWTVFDNAIDASSRISITSGYRHLIKIVATVLIVTHWLACGYGSILLTRLEDEYAGTTIGSAYVDWLYFTFYTVTTIGYGNVDVIGVKERAFAIVIMIVGSFLCDAGITSTLVSIVDIEDSTAAESHRYRDAALQLADHMHLPERIKSLVRMYHEYRAEDLVVKDEECFRELPFSLHNAVTEFLALQSLRSGPAKCKPLRDFRDGLLVSLFRALRNEVIVPMETLFASGERVLRLVCISRGRILAFGGATLSVEQLRRLGSSRRVLRKQNTAVSTERYVRAEEATTELLDPGLLFADLAWGEEAPVTLVTGGFCEALICDQAAYEALTAVRPPIGGLYTSVRELLETKEDAKHFEAFLKRRFMTETLDFVQLVQDFRRAPNNLAVRAKRAAVIVDRFIRPESDEAINIPADLAARVIEQVAQEPEPEAFDAVYMAAFATLEKELLPQFQASPEYEKMLVGIHRRSVLDFFPV